MNSQTPPPLPRTFWQIALWFFAVTSVAGLVAFFYLPSAPKTDFDIIGVLWLLQNGPRVGSLFIALVCAGGAANAWQRLKQL